ncbi:MAG: Gfo/Idh/MocA family oxidoreductase [Verrucomicrobiota bacterium]
MKRRDFVSWASVAAAGVMTSGAGVSRAADAGRRIKIGQIGTAHGHARGKMETMRGQADLFEVVGIVEADAGQRASVEGEKAYAGLNWMSEEELFAVPGIEAVAVETAVRDLVPTARRVVGAGLHVHLDKPAGDSMSAFRELLEAAEAKEVVVQLGYMLRYNPVFQLMYEAVAAGWIGEVMEIDCMMGKLAPEEMREELSEFSGGGMFELGGHLIDSIVYLMGKPEKVTPFLKRTMPERDEFADNGLAVLEWPKATAAVRVNMRDPFGFPRRRFQVAGVLGALEIMPMESGKATLSLKAAHGDYAEGVQAIQLAREGGRFDGEFRDFAAVIRGERSLAWVAAHDLAVHETLLRASGMPINPS